MKIKSVIGISVTSDNDSRYEQIRVRISEGSLRPLSERIAGTVDNRDGYGTMEAAIRVGRELTELVGQGYEHTFESGWSGSTLTVRYQVYERDEKGAPISYCHPRFELPENPTDIRRTLKLFNKIVGKNGYDCPETPEALVETFKKHVKVEYIGFYNVVKTPASALGNYEKGFSRVG